MQHHHCTQVKRSTNQFLRRVIEEQIQLMFQRVPHTQVQMFFGFSEVDADFCIESFGQLESFLNFLLVDQFNGFSENLVHPLAVNIQHFCNSFFLLIWKNFISKVSNLTFDFFADFCSGIFFCDMFQMNHIHALFTSQAISCFRHNFINCFCHEGLLLFNGNLKIFFMEGQGNFTAFSIIA